MDRIERRVIERRVGILLRAFLFVAVSVWLALPTFHVRASALPPFTRVVIDASFISPPWAKALGDIDGDGHPDVVAAFGGDNHEVYWYQYPTWSKHLISTHDAGGDIQLVDVNNDGSLDVVTATSDGLDGIAWYENPRGHGGNPAIDSWTRHIIENPVHWYCGHDVEAGDLNADGKIDVVIRVEDGPTYVYLQNSSDSWTKVLLSNASNGDGMALLDVNRDGRLDIVENGYWLEQPSDPVHGNWLRHDFAAWPSDSGVTVGDVNNDGRPDVVLTPEEHSGQISWFEQPADPINGNWIEHVILAPANYVHRVRLGDFNKDGAIDIAFAETSQSTTKRVGVLYNNGDGASWSLQVLATTAGHNIAIDDVQGDGDLDILNADSATGGLEIWRNDINNALSLNSWRYAQIDAIRSAKSFGLNFGDIDGDGGSDIVSGPYWYRNPGGDMTGSWTRFALPAGMDGMLVLDVDNDGRADIIAEGPIRGSSQLGLYWLRNNGQGTNWSTFLVGNMPPVPGDFEGQGYALARIVPGGLPEIVLTSGMGAYYFQVPADPALGNWPRVLISADITGKGIAAADINRDGKLDVVGFVNPDGTRIAWWENPGTGAGNWLRHDVGATSGIQGDRIAAADIDHDGRPDIVVTEANLGASGNSLFWFAQPDDLTHGTWTRRAVAGDQGSLNSMDVADMNADGNVDIITGEYRGNLYVSVWQNVNNGASFTQHIVSSGQESFLGARVFDLDHNGARDLVSIAHDTYPRLHLWRNDALSVAPPDTIPPAISASAANAVPGATASHSRTAIVGDAAGKTAASAAVGVAVNNLEPELPVTSALSAISTPTLVQHVSGSNAQQQVTVYNLPLPNNVLPGNCVIVGVRKDSDTTAVTVSDDQNNTYSSGPSRSDGSKTVALYYKLNVTNAPKSITVTFSGIGSYWVSVVASEFYNVATASAADGSNTNTGSGASLTANNIATTVDGDLIYNYAAVSGDDTSTEMSSWTPGSGYTLLSADLFDKHAAQYTIQTTHGTINPPMTMNPTGGWINVGMALKAGSAGTAPGAGIHVDKVLHNSIPVGWSSKTAKVQVPSAGNLLVAIFASEPSATITSISDTAGHSWTSTGADVNAGSSISGMKYVANPSASNTNVVTYTYAISVSGGDTCIVFDISGADPSAPFDKRGTASGEQLSGTSYTGASVTPATNNGLVISVNAVESNTVTAVSPETLIESTTTPQTSPWPDDENNGYAIQYNVDTSSITSSWTSNGPVGGWTEILAAFKSAPIIIDTTPPTVGITSPADGATVSGNVSVTATASDNVGVAGVQFKLDGANLGLEVTSAPYSVTWNTTTAVNGSHSLTAVARDAAGNTTTSAAVGVTVNNDTTPPTVSITAPADGATVAGNISVTATASDNVGVAGVQFKLDGANLGPEVTSAPYSVTWNTTTAVNGSHSLTAVARDAAGNTTTSAAVGVTVNNATTPPTVSITAPAAGATVSGNVSVTARASDNVGVTGVQFKLDGANLGLEVTSAPYSVTWNTTTAVNGSHSLTAVARDAAGNTTTSAAVGVTVNNATPPPTVSITAPAAGATVSGNVSVTATASDNVGVAGVQFKLDGANLGLEVTSAPYSVTWNTSTVVIGSHTLTAVARDAAGNAATSSPIAVQVIDSVLFLQAAGVSSNAGGTTISQTFNAAATAGSLIVAAVSWSNTGSLTCSDSQGNVYTTVTAQYDSTKNQSLGICYAANIKGGADTVTATFGGSSPYRRMLIQEYSGAAANNPVDVKAQDIAAGTTAPDNITTTPGITTVAGDLIFGAVMDDSGVNAIQAGTNFTWRSSVNGADLASEDLAQGAAGAVAATWTFSSADRYLAQMVAFKPLGLSGDNTPPTVSITAPADGATISGNVSVTATASDNGGLAGVQFQLDGTNLGAEVTAAPYSVSWNTTSATAGLHTLTAIARDAAGNRTTSSPVTVTVDNVPPMVSLTSPSNGATFSGTINVSATASDNVGVAGVQFQLDGANLGAEVTAAPYSVSWNTTSATAGSHTLTAIARDAAGNRTTSSPVTVTVDNVPPAVSISSPADGATVSGTITLTAAASANAGVVGVQYYLDGAALGTQMRSSPYSFSWDTTTVTNASHVLTAVARDAAGNTATSAAVAVQVSNNPSVVFKQSTGVSSNTASNTIARAFAATTGTGNLVVAAVSWGNSSNLSCSDSQGNVYTTVTAQYDSTKNQSMGICYAANIKGGADTVTATFGGSSPYRRMLIHEYSGAAANNPVDVKAQHIAAGTTAPDNITTTPGITTVAGDLIFSAVMDDSGVNAIQAGTNFTLRSSVNGADLASEDLVQGAAGSVAATWTFSSADRYLAQMVAFKVAGH